MPNCVLNLDEYKKVSQYKGDDKLKDDGIPRAIHFDLGSNIDISLRILQKLNIELEITKNNAYVQELRLARKNYFLELLEVLRLKEEIDALNKELAETKAKKQKEN